eukprot:2877352-Rhodomonas_salina.1
MCVSVCPPFLPSSLLLPSLPPSLSLSLCALTWDIGHIISPVPDMGRPLRCAQGVPPGGLRRIILTARSRPLPPCVTSPTSLRHVPHLPASLISLRHVPYLPTPASPQYPRPANLRPRYAIPAADLRVFPTCLRLPANA